MKVLMIKGNTETHVDELEVEEMKEKGFEVIDLKPVKAINESKEKDK